MAWFFGNNTSNANNNNNMNNTSGGCNYRYVIYLLVIIIFFYVIAQWANKTSRQYTYHVKHGLNDIVREASRMSTLAKQNGNPLLALIQNSEAVGMFKAARLLASDADLEHLTGGVPVAATDREIKEQQSASAKMVLQQCRDLLSPSRLAELAGYHPNLVSTSKDVVSPTAPPNQNQNQNQSQTTSTNT